MKPIPASAPIPAVPVLSNWLTVQAAEVAGDVARFKRATNEAHTAYLAAARRLVAVRGECRRGEWGAFLQAAGVEPRTARNMMQLARAGLSADDVTAAGGVQAALDALRAAAAGAVEVAGEALDAGNGGGEKPELNSVISGEPAGDVGDEAPVGAAVGRSDGDPGGGLVAVPPESVYGVPGGPGGRAGASPTGLRAQRRARGACADCGAHSGEAYRCPPCAARHRAAAGRTTDHARIGRALSKRIRAAAGRGAGLRLSADDVAGLVAGERVEFGARLARVGGKRR